MSLIHKDQQEYNADAYEMLKAWCGNSMFSLADVYTEAMLAIPKELSTLTSLADSIANISIISGRCFFSKPLKQVTVVSNNNMDFDQQLGTLKLKTTLSKRIEPRQGKSILATENTIKIRSPKSTVLKSIDDLLIKDQPIVISTKDSYFRYEMHIGFQSLVNLNNVRVVLGKETLAYPRISEIYYTDSKRERVALKLYNNNSYSLDLDLYKNSSNIYDLEFDWIESDNITLVFESVGLDLHLDRLECNLTEYKESGSIVFEMLNEPLPILKAGITGKSTSDSFSFYLSHDQETWVPIELSNNYKLDKDKVLSYNTIDAKSLKTQSDVKKLYLKVEATATEAQITFAPTISRTTVLEDTIDLPPSAASLALYEGSPVMHYGENYVDTTDAATNLYSQTEYMKVQNDYKVKGFVDSAISYAFNTKTMPLSTVESSGKALRVTGKVRELSNVDISTKTLNAFELSLVHKSLLDLNQMTCVVKLSDEAKEGIYYLRQNNTDIEIDLSLGFIKSALDVLVVVDRETPVKLLDSFKQEMRTLTPFTPITGVYAVSLLDTELFEANSISRTYPITPLRSQELGLLDGKLIGTDPSKEYDFYVLQEKQIYTHDFLSLDNPCHYKITAEDVYNTSISDVSETTPPLVKAYKLSKAGVVKGSMRIEGEFTEVPFINGLTEFEEVLGKTVSFPFISLSTETRVLLPDSGVIITPNVVYSKESENPGELQLKYVQEGSFTYVQIKPLSTFNGKVTIHITYSYKVLDRRKLFSVDADKGILYLSEFQDEPLVLGYKVDKLMLKGRAATQLFSEHFTKTDDKIQLKNYKQGSTISLLSTTPRTLTRSVSPVLQDVKLNYITLDDRSI